MSGSGVSSFKHLISKLPPGVHSVYYHDGIGNISSSHLRTYSRKSELDIEPQYPLFGGWNATFVIGYALPFQDFLFESHDGGRKLNFSFRCPIAETVVDKLTIKVVLPEGSKNPSALVPFLVEQHLEAILVYYDFHPIFMLAEPFMLVSVFFLLFVASLAYLHMDISIRK